MVAAFREVESQCRVVGALPALLQPLLDSPQTICTDGQSPVGVAAPPDLPVPGDAPGVPQSLRDHDPLQKGCTPCLSHQLGLYDLHGGCACRCHEPPRSSPRYGCWECPGHELKSYESGKSSLHLCFNEKGVDIRGDKLTGDISGNKDGSLVVLEFVDDSVAIRLMHVTVKEENLHVSRLQLLRYLHAVCLSRHEDQNAAL